MKISLAAMRVNRQMKQKDVAAVLAVDPSTLRNWEKGVSAPTIEQYMKLCKIYDCKPNDIFLPKESA